MYIIIYISRLIISYNIYIIEIDRKVALMRIYIHVPLLQTDVLDVLR